MDVIYEDGYITVCVKEAGVLSEEDNNKRSMPRLLKERYANESKKDVYTVHRLDKNVGGVMLFARTQKAASILTAAIRERDFLKEYIAVVYGALPEKEGVFNDLLFHDASQNKTYTVKKMHKGVREATLHYECVCSLQHGEKTLSLVKVKLDTGRTHQIRVQFASRRLPLVGDGRYGSGDKGDRPALWAHHIAFIHPKTGKPMDFKVSPPNIYPFELFCDLI